MMTSTISNHPTENNNDPTTIIQANNNNNDGDLFETLLHPIPQINELIFDFITDHFFSTNEYQQQTGILIVLFQMFEQKDLYSAQEMIMSSGVDLNQYLIGQSALTKCITEGFIEGVDFVLSFGVNVNNPLILDNIAISPLMTAVSYNQIEIINILIFHGANVNYQDPFEGCTSLIIAAAKQNLPAVKVLLLHYANPLLRNKSDATAYDIAKLVGNKELMRILKEAEERE